MLTTLCKLQLLDIFCGIAAGFAYRQMIVFACKMPGVWNHFVRGSTSSYKTKYLPISSSQTALTCFRAVHCVVFKKYKTFSVLIYSYINTSGNWKNEKLCGNTTLAGRSVFIQFRVFPIFTSVDITVYQYGKKCFIFLL